MNNNSPTIIFAASLESAREGETVLYYTRDVQKLALITRTTPTIIQWGARKFNRRGDERGTSGNCWNFSSIRVTNPKEAKDVMESAERKRLSNLLRDARWPEFTLDQLRQVSALCLSFQSKETPRPE